VAKDPNSERAEYNAKILLPIVRWLDVHRGEGLARSIASAASLERADLDGRNHWISQRQFETFLDLARAEMTTDEEFRAACVYRMAEGYGAMRFVLWAATPSQIYSLAVQTYKLVSTVGEPKILGLSRTELRVAFNSDRPISRLNCLIRQAQTADLPTLWGLPRATVHERSCVARGDPTCEYHLRYFTRRSWLPPFAGMLAGGALAAAAAKFGLLEALSMISLPALGGSIGFALEQTRTGRANLQVGEEQNRALRELAEEESEARRELLAFHHRQRDWTRVLEQETAEKSKAIQSVVDRMQRSQEERVREIRGFSHDLRSPLTALKSNVEFLADNKTKLGPEGTQIVGELEDAVDRMQRMLGELMQLAVAQAAPTLKPELIETGALTERLRRRLRAMVHGRDIRASVFRTRESPDSILADAHLLDRITDNLLTNAAKYTDRGSIVVEVDGSPGFLILKISDSGRGIDPEAIESVFHAGGSEVTSRTADSYGLGLSVVVQLLGQIGGRLEVMSKPKVGTTFWVYVPVKPHTSPSLVPPQPESRDPDELLRKVVKIRRMKSA
jgi:signal transduction histidine kinase